MPKILESVREQLLLTARAQIKQNGYAKTTIRSVAAECGIAVGTVYNYFPSKDMLIASFMAEDWRACFEAMQQGENAPKTRLNAIYTALRSFIDGHRDLFMDPEAARVYAAVFSARHSQLRSQLAGLILPLCAQQPDPAYLSTFIAEALLTWTVEGTPFAQLYPVISKLIL